MTDHDHDRYPGTDFWPVLMPTDEESFEELFAEHPDQTLIPRPRG